MSRILWNVAVALSTIGILSLVELPIRWTGAAEELRYAALGMIERTMGFFSRSKLSDVRIADTSSIEPRVSPTSRTQEKQTPRDELWDAVVRVAATRPEAIGIDIDFAPTVDGFVDPVEDPQFLFKCLQLSRAGLGDSIPAVPIFVGIHRSEYDRPEAWLGAAAFAPLAATIGVPVDRPEAMLISTEPIDGNPGGTEACLSLAARLASVAAPENVAKLREPGNGWLESGSRTTVVLGHQLHQSRLSAVDFGRIDEFKRDAIPIAAVDPVHAPETAGKIVILGDVKPESWDLFHVPGRIGQDVPGALLHASAVQTLIDGPLRQLTDRGKFALDLLSGVVLIVLFFIVQFVAVRVSGRFLVVENLQSLIAWLILGFQLIAGFLLTRWTRIVWDGFLVGLPLVFLSPAIERWLRPRGPRFLRAVKRGFQSLVHWEKEAPE